MKAIPRSMPRGKEGSASSSRDLPPSLEGSGTSPGDRGKFQVPCGDPGGHAGFLVGHGGFPVGYGGFPTILMDLAKGEAAAPRAGRRSPPDGDL